MRLNQFDLNLLVALDALLHEKSVTRAARRIFTSQPALSAALRTLREHFDDPLLVRIGRQLELTPRGRLLIEPVRQVLQFAQAAIGFNDAFDPAAVQRGFTLIVNDESLGDVLPSLIRTVAHEAPGIRCDVQQISADIFRRLESTEADLCIALESIHDESGVSGDTAFHRVVLRQVEWVCAVWSGNSQVEGTISLDQYLSMSHVFLQLPYPARPILHAARHLLKADVDIRATSQSLLQIPFLLHGTNYVATLTKGLASRLAPFNELRLLPLPFEVPNSREVLLWHRRLNADSAHAWLRTRCIDIARRCAA
jgi:LysR family transcriptional regulator, nod-box dependent transcriptional activator